MIDERVLSGIDTDIQDINLLSRRGFMSRLATGTFAAGILPQIAVGKEASSMNSETASPDNDSFWNHVADQFLLRPGVAYMNTGTRGPSPEPVFRAQIKSIEQANADNFSYASHVYTRDFKSSVRAKLAAFVGCKSNEIALTNNTTEGMVVGTFGPDLKVPTSSQRLAKLIRPMILARSIRQSYSHQKTTVRYRN